MKSNFTSMLEQKDKEIDELIANDDVLKTRVDLHVEKKDDADANLRSDMLIFPEDAIPPSAVGESGSSLLSK